MGVPAIHPDDPYRFVDGQDQLFLAGYYPGLQALIVGPLSVDDEYMTLIDRLAEKRINLLRVTLTFGMALTNYRWRHPYLLTDQCCSHKPPKGAWTPGNKFDLSRFDEEFFSYWDRVVSYAGAHGVVVQACLLDGAHTERRCIVNGYEQTACNPNLGKPIWGAFQIYGLDFDYYFLPNSIDGVKMKGNPTDQWYSDDDIMDHQKAFVTKAVKTLGGHDQLIWEIINEPASAATTQLVAEGEVRGPDFYAALPRESLGGKSWLQVMARTVHDAEQQYGHPAHLIMPADLPGHQAVAGHEVPVGWYNSNRTACSADNTFTLADYQNFRRDLVGQRPPKDYPEGAPLISDNDRSACPGRPVEQLPLWQRRKAWTTLVGGGYASLFVFDLFVKKTWNPVGLDHPAVLNGMKYVGLTARFVDDFRIQLAGTRPREKALNGENTAWSLDQKVDGKPRPYVVYFFQKGTAKIESIKNPAGCRWFDPRTGEKSGAGGDYKDSTFTTPASGTTDDDWVLCISAGAWS